MKFLLLVLSLLAFLSLSSCNESIEDIKDAINKETLTPKTISLIGKWQLEKAVAGNGIDVTDFCFMEEIIEFKINGTYIDRRNKINETTGKCELVGEFLRGFNNDNAIFETEKKELKIATYAVKKSTLELTFTIPFKATITYLRIYE